MDWIDNILSSGFDQHLFKLARFFYFSFFLILTYIKSESKVMVRYVQFAELDSITERFDAYAKPTDPSDETYQLIYTFFPEGMLSKSSSSSSSSSSNFYNISFQNKVDDFLVRFHFYIYFFDQLFNSFHFLLLLLETLALCHYTSLYSTATTVNLPIKTILYIAASPHTLCYLFACLTIPQAPPVHCKNLLFLYNIYICIQCVQCI